MIRFDSGDRTYQWCGGFGAILKSYEHGVRRGDVRMIGDELFYAYIVYPRWLAPSEVCWTVQAPSAEAIRALREKLLA